MGRVDTNATQYHQGLQFQEFHQTQAPETIDDAPPLEESQDLYEPPSDYQKPQRSVTNNVKPRFQVPSEAQSFPPSQPQAFPPPQDEPQSYPPNQDDDKPQAFPPPHQDHETPQPFPPIQTSDQFFHQQQNVGLQFPPQQTFRQPVGGIPVGVSPSPFISQVQNRLPNQPWKTHLFDCMKDPQNAIITVLFPCVTFGQIAEIVDSGSTSCGTSGMLYGLIACCIAMPCIMSCTYRSKMRSRFGLSESPAPDCVVHFFCECCALCQEYRELQERGMDPSIGWLGNAAKLQQKQQFAMTAPMQQRMM